MNSPRKGITIEERLQGEERNKWLITSLILLSLLTYCIFICIAGTWFEWTREYLIIVSTVLLEAAFVIYIVEDSIRRAEERRITQMKRYLEFERREGRRYEVEDKTMEFDIVNHNNQDYLKYTETLKIRFGDSAPETFYYPIYYDIPGEIKDPDIEDCPRIAEVRATIKTLRRETEIDLTKEITPACQKFYNTLFCPINIPLPQDAIGMELKIIRCYKYKEEHGNYFIRMIQDPVWTIRIGMTNKLFNKIKNFTVNDIEVRDFSSRMITQHLDIIRKENNNSIEYVLQPRADQLRNRFYIMDRIMVKVIEDETLGTTSHEENPITTQNN